MSEQKRKLAAIVFTDIVGFTKLSAENEPAALSLLEKQREILKPIVESHSGNWLKEIGDGLILSFNTNLEAVNCAIAIQKAVKEIEDLNLRIGIHQGEVVFQGNDVVGDDVNIASRIEPFASEGGVAISDRVNSSLERNPEFETAYLGKPQLKGVTQEVKVYCITSHGLPKTDLSKVSAKLEPESKFKWNIYSVSGFLLTIIGVMFWVSVSVLGIGVANENEVPAIAILPFENKGAPQDEFYAYGISSDLITDVMRAGLIRVASLGDVEKLDFKVLENSELAKKLFVRYVAKGTLWKMDSIFQLSMEIFDTKESKVIYNNRWQTNWSELTSIKDDLSDNILNTLKVEVNQGQDEHVVSINPDAYELYLKAKHKFEKRETFTDTEIARGLLEKAIELDINLLSAKILLGDTYEVVGETDKALDIYSSTLVRTEQIKDKLSKGICLNNIGWIYYRKSNNDKSLEFFERALSIFKELNAKHNIASCIRRIGIVYERKDEFEKSMENYLKSYDLFKELESKIGIARTFNSIGIGYSLQGEYEKAIEYYKKAILIADELENKSLKGSLLSNTAVEYSALENYNLAIDYYSKALKIEEELGDKKSISHILTWTGNIYNKMGDFDKPLQLNQKALNYSISINDSINIASTIVTNGYFYSKKGFYDKAYDSFSEGLSLREEIGFNHLIINSLNNFGYLYFNMGDFEKAIHYYERSIELTKEEKQEKYKQDYGILSYLYLSYKNIGKPYDKKEIHSLLEEENIEEFSYEFNFVLYQLLDDRTFLEKAYNIVIEKTKWLDDEKYEKFLNYPIPNKIVEEWNKLDI